VISVPRARMAAEGRAAGARWRSWAAG